MTFESHLFAAALGAMVPSLLLLLLLEKQWDRELPPECSGALDRVFWLLPDAISPHLECLGVSGRALYKDFYAFDLLLFPLIYSTALMGLLRRLWPERRLVWTLPGIAAVCDVAENVSILQLLKLFPDRWKTLEIVVSVLTRTKWVVVLSAIVFVLVGALRMLAYKALKLLTYRTVNKLKAKEDRHPRQEKSSSRVH
ncbi:hypothetical protein KXD40_007075 [Peronospora effusa]|uniref:Uncharacterized protein n=1 Tax=Peronospora effusa TaxID=542832 RepID=A0A3M6VF85_9STRA|nr:hypothetical protein DD238_006132 [Peronospora effusa]RQM13195.1 hypothetical protein DD237_006209 [Peronospora effusa]UIZ25130.1 hypothetical protein KXD40_007075 [Peronospora effusa]CAI5710811.1 unnamed protein product [Peronospora effusa]